VNHPIVNSYLVLTLRSRKRMDLSDAARELLLEASRDPAGLILRLTAPGGRAYLKTNSRAFGDESPDDQARWESGVRQLLAVALVEPAGNRVFCITHEGYQAADCLQRRK
jgi:hypothetical protein